MKLLHILLAILFIVFAVIQFNDPDPWLWATLYGLVAVAAGLALLGKDNLPFTLVVAVACLAAVAWSTPGFIEYITAHRTESIIQDMAPERPYIEETREFGGALIAFLAAVFYAWRARVSRRSV